MTMIREMLDDAFADPKTENSVVKPYVLSHGTLECFNLRQSRRFYEEFLGMECVQHGKRSMGLRCGLKFHVICVEVGAELHPLHFLNHWGLDVSSREEVDAAYEAAIAMREKYSIGKITETIEQHGVYSFYLEDLDHNWWEIQYYDGYQHNDIFDFGDVFDSSKS
ncbi:VOC domain-containing protein OS=Eoetvoesiella caeni OX=645616 GN=DFR37_10763 PE=4 SV=1 [Eoetvoesiella caeni]